MDEKLPMRLEAACGLLALPIDDVEVISRLLPSRYAGISCSTTLVDRTFLCISFKSAPPKTVIFFLGAMSDEIDVRVIGLGSDDASELCEIIRTDDEDVGDLCMTAINQFLNPVFNFGSAPLSRITTIVLEHPVRGEIIVGIVFTFPFGVRLGLHVFDDHRLSICFNEMCDVIITQARGGKSVHVIEKTFELSDKPHFSELSWFDWLDRDGHQL